jgi:hypothetical protein
MADFAPPLPALDDTVKPGTRDWAILEWCNARLSEGQKFLESQVGYDKIDKALHAIFAYEQNENATYNPVGRTGIARTRANFVAKTAEDLTAMLTDTRVFWNYGTHNPKYQPQVALFNKDAEDWYTSRNIDLRVGDVVRYYTYCGTGVAHLYYSRAIDDMMVDALDPRNVIPVNPVSNHSYQDCEGVIVRQARTPHWVSVEYDKDVAPDANSGGYFGWFTRAIGNAKNKISGPLSGDRRAKQQPEAIPATPTVFVNTLYLKDRRTNKTSQPVYMGDWIDGKATNQWSYKVEPGAPLYPFNRMIVWCTGHKLYDGPAPYWHAKFPLIKLTLNPWPVSFLGKAPLWDILPLNQSLDALLSVIDDHAAQVAQPGAIADKNVSRAEFSKFNTRSPGYKVRTNLASGKGITVVPPPPLDQSLWQQINWLIETIQKLSGTADVSQMSQLAQIPSDDTIDTIMKAMTPGVRLRSRILEGFMKEFAEMYMWSIVEFDTLPKRIARFGPSAITDEDFDYDPNTFIPDDIPDGTPGDIGSTVDAIGTGTPRPLYERAKAMLLAVTCQFDPSSLLNTAAQQDLMKYFLLAKMGYMSVFTLMEKMGMMNFAPKGLDIPPDEISRLQLQQQLGIGMIANAQGRKATDSAPPSMGSSGGGPIIQTS